MILIFSACAVSGQSDLSDHVVSLGDKQFVPVCRITSEALNQQFINGVQNVKKQIALLAAYDTQIADAVDSEELNKLEAERADLANRVDANTQYLKENFQYNIRREFILVIEDSHVYRGTSEEEVDGFKRNFPDQDWDASVRRQGDSLFILARVVEGAEENKKFENLARALQMQFQEKGRQDEIRTAIESGNSADHADPAKRDEFFAYYDELLNTFAKNEAYMSENYNVTAEAGFVRVVINSRLLVEVTEEELKRLPDEGVAVLF